MGYYNMESLLGKYHSPNRTENAINSVTTNSILFEQAQNLTTQWLWVYNNERPYFALGGIPSRTKVA
jgi:transposase InsO family protein